MAAFSRRPQILNTLFGPTFAEGSPYYSMPDLCSAHAEIIRLATGGRVCVTPGEVRLGPLPPEQRSALAGTGEGIRCRSQGAEGVGGAAAPKGHHRSRAPPPLTPGPFMLKSKKTSPFQVNGAWLEHYGVAEEEVCELFARVPVELFGRGRQESRPR